MRPALKNGVHKKILLLLLAFAIVFDFTGCVSMSAQARRERAYRHYVAKQIKTRQKAIARAQKQANREMKLKMKSIQPSEPKVIKSLRPVKRRVHCNDRAYGSEPGPAAVAGI